MKEAETGQRGFIISHDTVFLEPYKSAHERVNGSFLILKYLTAEQKEQQPNLDSLLHLLNYRFELLETSLVLAVNAEMNHNELDLNLRRGRDVMDLLRMQVNKINEVEMGYFKLHQRKYEHEIFFTPIIAFLLLMFTLMVFTFSFIKINRDLVVLIKSNKQLIIKTESINHAEIIGEFCTTQWDPETHRYAFSDNLYRMLGVEPQSFEPTIENYIKFVHPEDRKTVEESYEQTTKENKINPLSYRIIRKDGELRYFRSRGKAVSEGQRNITHIGIIKDVTQMHLNSIELEERNHALEQSIKELESFNRIASHDLQEPLRKIQTFISRISEKEALTLSDSGKEYFEKILTSVTRMRVLIDDLLLFSRTTKTEKVFEPADLNQLLENALQELSHDIEEKNAVFFIPKLPVLNVIAFQIQQLFMNLIGNSLKYSKPGISPKIRIECKKVMAQENPILKPLNHNAFYKISVIDNGLGFEQEYAENIFNLFQRLHHEKEFPGSGIGLSICKKIVENHSGFITAEGIPGIGSSMHIFLPK